MGGCIFSVILGEGAVFMGGCIPLITVLTFCVNFTVCNLGVKNPDFDLPILAKISLYDTFNSRLCKLRT